MRRWSLHILPKGNTKTRRFGGYSNRHRDRYIAECRELIAASGIDVAPVPLEFPGTNSALEDSTDAVTPCCPHCRMKMRWIGHESKQSWRIIMHSGLRPHWYRND